MKKQITKNVSIVLTALLLNPIVHAAASNSASSNTTLSLGMYGAPIQNPAQDTVLDPFEHTDLRRNLLREFARDEFFKQLDIVRKNQPEITDPQQIMSVAVSQMPEIPEISEDYKKEYQVRENPFIVLLNGLPLSDYFGLSIQDLIDHKLLPMIKNNEAWNPLRIENLFIDDLKGIENIPGIQNVRLLSIKNNRIASLLPHTFKNLTNLNTLYLMNNPLSKIFPNAFAGLDNLFQLTLSRNQLKSIDDPATFAGLNNLHDLHLDFNSMQTFNPKALAALPRLNKLTLYYNQLSPENIKAIDNELKAMNKRLQLFFTEPQEVPPTPTLTDDMQTSKRGREEISSGSELINNNEKEARTAHSD